MIDKYKVKVVLNHNTEVFDVSKSESLACVLKEQANLSWPAGREWHKEKCNTCRYNAFPVLLNGNAVNASFILAMDVDRAEIDTLDGLYKNPTMESIVDSFLKYQADQYGYCVPGMEMALYALLRYNPTPRQEDIRRMLSGNLCSCNGKQRIEEAINNIAEIVTLISEREV